jgi:hypothetical protein
VIHAILPPSSGSVSPHFAKPHDELARIALLSRKDQLDREAFVVVRRGALANTVAPTHVGLGRVGQWPRAPPPPTPP